MTTETTKTAKFYRFIVSERTNRSIRCEGTFASEAAAKAGDWTKLLPSRYRTILSSDQLTGHDWKVVADGAGPDPETCGELREQLT